MTLKEMLIDYHDIEFIYKGKKYYLGRCNTKKRQELYYLKADEYEERIFNNLQNLLDAKIEDCRLEEITDKIEIVETF